MVGFLRRSWAMPAIYPCINKGMRWVPALHQWRPPVVPMALNPKPSALCHK